MRPLNPIQGLLGRRWIFSNKTHQSGFQWRVLVSPNWLNSVSEAFSSWQDWSLQSIWPTEELSSLFPVHMEPARRKLQIRGCVLAACYIRLRNPPTVALWPWITPQRLTPTYCTARVCAESFKGGRRWVTFYTAAPRLLRKQKAAYTLHNTHVCFICHTLHYNLNKTLVCMECFFFLFNYYIQFF